MQVSFDFKMKKLTQLILCAAMMTAAQGAFADDVVDLGTVQSTAADDTVQAKDSASYQAPTKGSLVSTQPQSTISQHFIQETAAAGANYSDIVNIAPSVFSVDPNGPGLMETQSLTMRGFQDGQFNVTFDGIPWATPTTLRTIRLRTSCSRISVISLSIAVQGMPAISATPLSAAPSPFPRRIRCRNQTLIFTHR